MRRSALIKLVMMIVALLAISAMSTAVLAETVDPEEPEIAAHEIGCGIGSFIRELSDPHYEWGGWTACTGSVNTLKITTQLFIEAGGGWARLDTETKTCRFTNFCEEIGITNLGAGSYWVHTVHTVIDPGHTPAYSVEESNDYITVSE